MTYYKMNFNSETMYFLKMKRYMFRIVYDEKKPFSSMVYISKKEKNRTPFGSELQLTEDVMRLFIGCVFFARMDKLNDKA